LTIELGDLRIAGVVFLPYGHVHEGRQYVVVHGGHFRSPLFRADVLLAMDHSAVLVDVRLYLIFA